MSIDEAVREPWGDVAVWPADVSKPRNRDWMDTAFAALTVAVSAIGAVGVLRLMETRERLIVRETRGGRWA